MKIPSLGQILQSGSRTFLRFPLVLVSALIGTVSAFILMDQEGPEAPTILFQLLCASILGIPLLLGIALTAERRMWGTLQSLGAHVVGILLLCFYASTVPATLASAPAFHLQRLLLLALSLHLFVSVGPYLGSGGQNAFWNYNKTLFFRILGAALYSHVLYLGLSLALAALDQLFGIDIPGKRYGELWIVAVGILNTWLFLAGIPEHLDTFDQPVEYPKSLRILAQYVLVPLSAIYALVIYAYIAKILFSGEWSDGWISKLTLGFAVTGSLALVLANPLRGREAAGWISIVSRWFPFAMIPLVIIFPLAVWRRISEYGLTEARYIAAVLAVWLITMVVYLLFSKARNMKVFATTLGALSLLVSIGPWNVFQVSEQSQTERLKQLLVQDSILVDGHIRKVSSPVSHETSKNISSILDYLHMYHGYDRIQSWFSTNLRLDTTGVSLASKDPALIAEMMGVPYVRLRQANGGSLVSFGMDQNASIDVQGFDRLVRLQFIGKGGIKKEIPGDNILLELNSNLDTLTVRGKDGANALSIDFRSLASKLLAEYANEGVGNVPAEKLTLSGMTAGLRVKVFLRGLQVRRRGDNIEIGSLSADVAYSMEPHREKK